MTKQRITANPGEWIITRRGDFVRIKDSETAIEENLTKIREHLKKPYRGLVRFHEKTSEQIVKERYDKVLEEVDFDYEKFHDWIYDEKNKERIEIIPRKMIFSGWEYEIDEVEYQRDINAVFNYVKGSRQKWRIKKETLVNEETGQIIYFNPQINGIIDDLRTNWDYLYNGDSVIIREPRECKPKGKHASTLIFLHGTYGAGSLNQLVEKIPGLKIIHPHSPTLQYDMWHGSSRAPGGQEKGWINITGDAWEIMENDVVPNNPSQVDYEKVDQSIHLDYPQLRRAMAYVNEIIEREIASGIPPEKIFISGYSQGGLLTLAMALTSQHKLGGFISLCGLLPRPDKLLKIAQDKNKNTPILIINNSHDRWVPLWTGQKTYEILKNKDYNVEFKTRPGLGHGWKDEDIVEFLEKCLTQKISISNQNKTKYWPWILGGTVIAILFLIIFTKIRAKKKKKKKR
ncbi:Putative Acyl-protein thioesterase [endosymbiont DhMRE of Dentiscutata heterogama]|uniref:prolyl oligopeptidase family serine peptidase n=1 Tax=endosymbiont DhMRE of Dentiscutata heterogama TaxID=1609546 RepID=UPI000629D4BB|nr:prolyl oligopeptidase family serine peptidase [endosymbiont DhMRE of Dentiscutata heterogama]CFW92852.1 Putative Acyl-protein thioesterase [endosymbiont DhMRE of Dentiscutata heterogama]